jgi:hypothetical protein
MVISPVANGDVTRGDVEPSSFGPLQLRQYHAVRSPRTAQTTKRAVKRRLNDSISDQILRNSRRPVSLGAGIRNCHQVRKTKRAGNIEFSVYGVVLASQRPTKTGVEAQDIEFLGGRQDGGPGAVAWTATVEGGQYGPGRHP